MIEHTKEPWSTKAWMYGVMRIFSGSKYLACVDNTDDNEAQHSKDARRIVACVNACAGISTEDLELGKVFIRQGNVPHGSNTTVEYRIPAEYAIPLTPDRDPLETPE